MASGSYLVRGNEWGGGGRGGVGVGGDSLVGFRLKFSDFVISRLKLSVVGKSQLVCKDV